jgi:hypothetical protein
MMSNEKLLQSTAANVKAAGGPFPVNMQIGYGNNYYLQSTCLISQSPGGSTYDSAKISFTDIAGTFQPGAIFLNPQNPTVNNVTLQSGLQVLTITNLAMGFPTPDTQGNITLQCSYTDYNGKNPKQFNGTIAVWNGTGPAS